MTLATRFLARFWTGFKVARFARQQQAPGRVSIAQRTAFTTRMQALAGTEFASLHRLSARTSYAQFREQVPLRGYEWFEPFIRRMAGGEWDVLVRGKCPLFVESAGASGATKLLPAPAALQAHCRAALDATLFLYAQRAGHTGVFRGRHLHLGATTQVNGENGAPRTSFDGLLALSRAPWIAKNLRAPSAAIAGLPEGRAKTEATARAMLRENVTLIAGTPGLIYLLALAARDLAGSGAPRPAHLQGVWPRLECCLHTGAPLGVFGDALRTALGPSVKFHEVYAGAEGIFAAQDGGNPAGLRVLADTGIFFEFLPHSALGETSSAKAAKCVPLGEVQPDIPYVPVITTPAGLVRYVTGDIVRFVTVDPPRLQFTGRATLELDSCGERVTERELFDSLQAVCARNGWQAIALHVAPYSQRGAGGQVALAHEWWLELVPHTMKTPTANVLAPEFDAELRRRNAVYAELRTKGTLGAPQVRLVMPGVFENWAREQKKTASASKLPRCRSDRTIADQLAALAPFHQATMPPFKPGDLPV